MNSIFDLFKISIGPSSSHTVGPMSATKSFCEDLDKNGLLSSTKIIKIELFGSLAYTGKAHGTDKALIIGLLGHTPSTIDTSKIKDMVKSVQKTNTINVIGKKEISFNMDIDIIYNTIDKPDFHSNALTFTALDVNEKDVLSHSYYSIGGGTVLSENDIDKPISKFDYKYPFSTCSELLEICHNESIMIYDVMLANEKYFNSLDEIKKNVSVIWETMNDCINRGLSTKGILDGGLKVERRAPQLYSTLSLKNNDPLNAMDFVNVFAIAVNEENASGGRVVTAPTNGAAGVIPAVIKYCYTFLESFGEKDLLNFYLTSGAIGNLYKYNASISGAEVGCQGEVGVACSMAAAGLAAVLGGSNEQIENAAEIAMEHNLGLTCDPISGLVQIPCIERNAMGAVKSINAARIAMKGMGNHKVSLDDVIQTMMETGKDMMVKYKETSEGGLAVNVVEC